MFDQNKDIFSTTDLFFQSLDNHFGSFQNSDFILNESIIQSNFESSIDSFRIDSNDILNFHPPSLDRHKTKNFLNKKHSSIIEENHNENYNNNNSIKSNNLKINFNFEKENDQWSKNTNNNINEKTIKIPYTKEDNKNKKNSSSTYIIKKGDISSKRCSKR